jgi:predicted nuclease of restriction endonuclease-like (RecB) superfamily
MKAARKGRGKGRSQSAVSAGSIQPADYAGWLVGLKERIASARQLAALAVNQELVRLYHDIGREILDRQTRQGWGAKVIDRLAADLRDAFPEMKGFSSRNLKYMKFFAEICPDLRIGQQPAAQLPWFHLVTLLTKVSDAGEREWYAAQTLQQGWSRSTLDVHIKNRLHRRRGVAVTNFDLRLPTPHSRLAGEALKDPYLFDFLGLGEEAHERDIEDAEYALSGIDKPMGVAEYQLLRALPEPLDTALPTIEQIERELSSELPSGKRRKEGET